MEPAKILKSKWSELSDYNSGHTPNQWGIQKRKSIQCLILYLEMIKFYFQLFSFQELN